MSSHREFDLFAPTPEHALLAETLEAFVAREVEPQAAEHDRDETFNHALFRRAGELGLLGVTLPEEYLAWARIEGNGNVSAGLRRLLEELDQITGLGQALTRTSARSRSSASR